MAKFLIQLEVDVQDAEALARYGQAAAETQGFTAATWRAYRETRGGSCADLVEWIPQGPAGATVERVSCTPIDGTLTTSSEHVVATRASVKGAA